MINTIGCASYNEKERKKLGAKLLSLQEKSQRLQDLACTINDKDELSKIEREICEVNEMLLTACRKCFAAQFHRCNNTWFAKFVEKLVENDFVDISEEQYYCFCKYVCDTDESSVYRGTRYCRVGDYLVTLLWNNSQRAIKKENVNAS